MTEIGPSYNITDISTSYDLTDRSTRMYVCMYNLYAEICL